MRVEETMNSDENEKADGVKETTITATQLSRSTSDVLNRVRYRGERFIIERNGEPVATLEPTRPRSEATLRDFVAFVMSHPTPDDTFADDLEAIQSAQPIGEPSRNTGGDRS